MTYQSLISSPPIPWSKTDPDCVALSRFCHEGRLFEVQEYIAAGKTVNYTHGNPVITPLGTAIEKGFYSLAELLLRNGATPRLDHIYLIFKRGMGKKPYLDLILAHGFDLQSVKGWYPHYYWGKESAELFLEHGDVLTGYPIFKGLVAHPKTFSSLLRKHLPNHPEVQFQLDMALRHYCRTWDTHQLSLAELMLKAGANRRALAPLRVGEAKWQWENSIMTAVSHSLLSVVKRLSIDPKQDDLEECLVMATLRGDPEIISHILALGANPDTAAKKLRRYNRIRFRASLRLFRKQREASLEHRTPTPRGRG